ncbi:MotA/TolQ/ExbB proton channel family protein [Phragmitibacter flavus]|uniref:MotA/TolQ/ExbB proton channel family protein n=1 Tax=Phragmitibacter flavus TaxID=2576071 RepID=A0A5R8KIT5_9BACT|nr:MotA/TolQ/ExbB proton channel family protein [Phragmitibacter flavus]TLD72192.1 MotA/TolQ/ExbB proton channel family protein [Phragmitibacter flavus]
MPRSLITILLVLFTLLPALVAQEPTAPEPEVVAQKSLLDLYNTGGSLMHIILLCSIGTIAAGIYCFIAINPKKMMPKTTHASMIQFARHKDVNSAYQLCESAPSTYSNIISPSLLKINFERDLANKSSMEQAAADALDREETKQMTWVNYLNVFATIAPMLGLLGTVTGMIASFDMLSAGKSEPSDLAGGIGEAMTTTAAGLIVGIPAMFLYFFFKGRLTIAMSDIQKNATFIIDIFSGDVTLAEDDARAETTPPAPAETTEPALQS